MKLSDLLGLDKGRILSIVGSGGKTTFMYTLAEELRDKNKVLVTTTTKIYVPEKERYDYLVIGNENIYSMVCNEKKGVYVYGGSINKENKLSNTKDETIDELTSYFDYTLIEADGAKRKPVKGWNTSEPVICISTQKTVGILSIEAIGMKINDYNVHRIEEFMYITNSKRDELITVENAAMIVTHSEGLFKNSKGEKVLFINKVEGIRDEFLAQELIKNIVEKDNNYIDKIIIGSLRNRNYKIYIQRDD